LDFQKFNIITVSDKTTLPIITEAIDSLSIVTYCLVFDVVLLPRWNGLCKHWKESHGE